MQRELAPSEVVRRHVREEDEHVHRYMAAMDDIRFSTTWRVLWADDRRYDPVMVPCLWVSTACAPGTASGLDSFVVFIFISYLASDVFII